MTGPSTSSPYWPKAKRKSGTVLLAHPDLRGWWYKVACGETVQSYSASSKQAAADQATALWPNLLARERARRTKLEDERRLDEQLDAAQAAGTVDVMAFGLGSATYDRLISINEHLRHQGRLDGPLKPLAEAVSAELYRRRVGE